MSARGMSGGLVTMGDFSEVHEASERFGSHFNENQTAIFNMFISNATLNDVPLGGYKFTWIDKWGSKMSKFDRLDSSKLKNEHPSRLSLIDVKIDHGNATDLEFLNRRESSRILGDLDRITVSDLAQKARIKWASEGDENSSFFHATLKKCRRHLAIKVIKESSWIVAFPRTKSKRLFGIVEGCNSSSIALIPKVPNAMLIMDFIIVSLIGCQYKIVSKILANRLSMVIGSCISPEQYAFIKGWSILDGPFILNEVIEWYRKRKKKLMIFEVDFEKAFDFLRSSVLINGSPMVEFEISRGLRQGDPLSPFIFILAMEGLHTLTCKALDSGIFTGAYIGNDNLRISNPIYADDVIFFGSRASKLPLKYLDVPVGCNMSRYANLDAIINKFCYKLSRWKACMIFVGGHLNLIKSVLSSLPTYCMSLYKNKCLASKKLGGPGIGSIFGLNAGLLFKWIWRFMQNLNDLWASVIKAIHGYNGGIHADSRHSSNQGNISSICFWDDAWCGNRPLKVLFSRVHLLNIDKGCQVVNQISSNDWNSFLRRPARGDSSKGFTVASVRHIIDARFLDVSPTATRWIRDIPIKVNVCLWRLSLNKLPSMMKLDKKSIDVDSILCPICNDDVETVNHLFFSCDMAKDLWSLLARWWELGIPFV
nr:RNA-directed DNA polymerase, eukaryota, reverse transcriptase zinc-binding domain protein [Tanacetum cinerariifolium]